MTCCLRGLGLGLGLNQVCEIHTKFKSQVITDLCIACLLFGILPLGGDF